ncbi:hypothetical protein OU789_10835 [Halocynthiibacter sp. C4]|uniref:hypothetical protein n=1 Tax=Halocynthiibacter sp. C4 TaxID=2992758 RepID=UPI00237A90CD|nr:hypothetical protein [Halocynthiibacter sp. C4]MDE0590422.1 hypothetical protein [Halocynthiibacter sp. C4]
MTTVNDIVTRAFRKIGVVGVDNDLQDDSASEGLIAFNMMLHGWKLQGVDITHTDQTLTDTFALDPEFEEGTVYLLAKRLEPDYHIPPAFDADAWFRQIQNSYAEVEEATIPSSLLNTPSQRTYC